LISAIVRFAKGDPLRVGVGTAVLTLLVALDGDGSTTFLIVIAALAPIYDKLGMSRVVMATIIGLGTGLLNMTPWGGPTTRAITLLNGDTAGVFNPVIPAMAVGAVWVIFAGAVLGWRERQRLGIHGVTLNAGDAPAQTATPRLFWFNLALTAVLMVAVITEALPLSVLFIGASAIALLVNFPKWDDQRQQLAGQADAIVTVLAMIFAAGIFTGILTGTKMISSMAEVLVAAVPTSMAVALPVVVALTSMPLSLVVSADAYYFGVLPVLMEAAKSMGLDPYQIVHAAILGHTTTGFPVSPLVGSTYVLIGRAGITLGEHQRSMIPWAFGTTVVMTVAAWLTGAI
jgi:CitMHS family citrate-Mg2+:H+ or citrate-Ca2+:H+ symporter